MESSADFTSGKVFQLILKFSIPAAISLLVTAIYNIVDRIFIGNFNGSTALAALSICFPLSFMMIAFGLMCSAGGSTIFTLFRGKNDEKNANSSFGMAFVLTIFFEMLLTALLLIFSDFFLQIFGVTETTYTLALQYYNIIAIGCLFQGLALLFCDFTRVSGRPILAMSITGIGAITNIILDALFIVVFDFGVKGAAFATVIGQLVSTIFGIWLIFSGRTLVKYRKEIFNFEFSICKSLLSCGFAFWIAQISMGFIAIVYNSQLGKYGGDLAISVYAVISSIMTFVIMPASGISQGIQPLIGYSYSCGDMKRVKEIFFKATLLSVGVTTVVWLLTEIFPTLILRCFGGDKELMEIGPSALRANFIIAPVLGFVMLATTFFQSIGKPTASSVITLVRQVAAIVPLIYILPIFFEKIGIFFAQPASDLLATLLSGILIYRQFKTFSKT